MCAVPVDMNALHIGRVAVSADVAAPLHHKAALSLFLRLVGKDRAKESGADDQIIIHIGAYLAFDILQIF